MVVAPRPRAAVVAAVVSLVLGACGSQLEPDQVAATGTSVGVGGDAGVPGLDPGSGGPAGSIGGGGGSTVDGATGAGTAGGTGGSGGTAGGSAPGDGGPGGPEGGGGAPIPVGSCDGFRNGPGITDDTIVIGNSSDISGPVPGLFESAQDAVKAFVAYFNRVNPDGICGRSLELKNYDSRTDSSADQRNHLDACQSVFAMVGSMSAFDSGGADATQDCGLPDIRSAAVTGPRQQCSTCFGAQSTIAGQVNNAVPDFIKENFPEAAQNAAMTYVNAGAAAENGPLQAKAYTARGMRFVYEEGIETSDFNYAPYVQAMKDAGARSVSMVAAIPQFVRLAQAMQQQGFEPDVFMLDPTAYEPDFIESGGEAVEGTIVYTNFVPFEEAARSPETALYLQWLQATKPGATPDFFGVFAWSAARLFVERAARLGGKLTRDSLVGAVRTTDDWTANGLHSPQHVGPKRTGECFRFIQVRDGRWAPVGGTKYRCNGVTTVR